VGEASRLAYIPNEGGFSSASFSGGYNKPFPDFHELDLNKIRIECR
jgi:hypothetical protein